MSEEDEDDDLSLLGVRLKWKGPLDARKIVERIIAGIISGISIGIGFLAVQELFGWFHGTW